MLLTNHVLSGALIGALSRRPLPAFAAGVASHFVLDAMPHWGQWRSRRRFLHVAVPDGLISLAAMGTFAAVSPPDRRLAVLAGMTGAARRVLLVAFFVTGGQATENPNEGLAQSCWTGDRSGTTRTR